MGILEHILQLLTRLWKKNTEDRINSNISQKHASNLPLASTHEQRTCSKSTAQSSPQEKYSSSGLTIPDNTGTEDSYVELEQRESRAQEPQDILSKYQTENEKAESFSVIENFSPTADEEHIPAFKEDSETFVASPIISVAQDGIAEDVPLGSCDAIQFEELQFDIPDRFQYCTPSENTLLVWTKESTAYQGGAPELEKFLEEPFLYLAQCISIHDDIQVANDTYQRACRHILDLILSPFTEASSLDSVVNMFQSDDWAIKMWSERQTENERQLFAMAILSQTKGYLIVGSGNCAEQNDFLSSIKVFLKDKAWCVLDLLVENGAIPNSV